MDVLIDISTTFAKEDPQRLNVEFGFRMKTNQTTLLNLYLGPGFQPGEPLLTFARFRGLGPKACT